MKREAIFVTLHGKTKSILQWCFEYGMSPSIAYERYEKGIRGKELFLQNDPDHLSKSVVHQLWGGKWVYVEG